MSPMTGTQEILVLLADQVNSYDLYGEPLKPQFEFAPYFTDTVDLGSGAYSSRAWLANTHFYLGFFFLQGHLWHALRAMGFDFKKIGQAFDNIENTKITQN